MLFAVTGGVDWGAWETVLSAITVTTVVAGSVGAVTRRWLQGRHTKTADLSTVVGTLYGTSKRLGHGATPGLVEEVVQVVEELKSAQHRIDRLEATAGVMQTQLTTLVDRTEQLTPNGGDSMRAKLDLLIDHFGLKDDHG